MSNAFLADLEEFAGKDDNFHLPEDPPIRIHKKKSIIDEEPEDNDFSLDTIAIRRKQRG